MRLLFSILICLISSTVFPANSFNPTSEKRLTEKELQNEIVKLLSHVMEMTQNDPELKNKSIHLYPVLILNSGGIDPLTNAPNHSFYTLNCKSIKKGQQLENYIASEVYICDDDGYLIGIADPYMIYPALHGYHLAHYLTRLFVSKKISVAMRFIGNDKYPYYNVYYEIKGKIFVIEEDNNGIITMSSLEREDHDSMLYSIPSAQPIFLPFIRHHLEEN